jgi:hypothetical protein
MTYVTQPAYSDNWHFCTFWQTNPGLLNRSCGAWNLAKFGLHAGNMKFHTQNKE